MTQSPLERHTANAKTPPTMFLNAHQLLLPLSLCVLGLVGVARGDGNCLAHQMAEGMYIPEIPCIWPTFCCGDCNGVYCCISNSLRISDFHQEICNMFHMRSGVFLGIVAGVGVLILLLVVLICCRCCSRCYYYRHRQQPYAFVHIQEPHNGEVFPGDQTLYPHQPTYYIPPNANYGQYPHPPPPAPAAGHPARQWQG
ncbi:unnamed protein product [Lampetra fluviatilis]